jgi:hypothetical protein
MNDPVAQLPVAPGIDPALVQLCNRFPRLLHNRRFFERSSLPDGWLPIVEQALRAVDALLDEEDARHFRVRQIKEKFGELKIYCGVDGIEGDERAKARILWRTERADGTSESHSVDSQTQAAITAICRLATFRSAITCEVCGAAGRTRDGRYVETLCDQHAEERGSRNE